MKNFLTSIEAALAISTFASPEHAFAVPLIFIMHNKQVPFFGWGRGVFVCVMKIK